MDDTPELFKPGITLVAFSGVNRFLSNFYEQQTPISGALIDTKFQWDSLSQYHFHTVEHAYQACKSTDPQAISKIVHAVSAAQAKFFGARVQLREHWDEIKLDLMRHLLEQKFGSPRMGARLRATWPAKLVEGNTWGDQFWGVSNGQGENHLGRLLMEIRAELWKDLENGYRSVPL